MVDNGVPSYDELAKQVDVLSRSVADRAKATALLHVAVDIVEVVLALLDAPAAPAGTSR